MKPFPLFKKYKYFLIIALALFVIPLFWLKPGEMDLGGDGNRLYFYDPINYIKSTAIYDISFSGKGVIEPLYIYLPYLFMVMILRVIFSPTLTIGIINGFKLSLSFLSVCLIVYELLHNEEVKETVSVKVASILAGFMYIVSLGIGEMSFPWDRALVTHNQIFLNPLMFYLLLKFVSSNRFKYLWIALVISFIFAPNFGPVAAPPFFAFYPLAIFFLLVYRRLFIHRTWSLRKLTAGALLFGGLQAFHLVAEGISLLDKGSIINTIVFSKQGIENGGVAFFQAISGMGKVSLNLLLSADNPLLRLLSIVTPSAILVGIILAGNLRKKILLTTVFFLTTLYLSSANITKLGYELQK